ncbi:MAG: M91 family zinc metallopeptidase [Acidimicrobiales bacterium]
MYAGAGDDYVDGQGGHDRVVGGDGDDIVYGGAGDDLIEGGTDDDHLDGGAGGDEVRGDAGRDLLSGGRDDDVLDGGEGDDDLLGGRGADTAAGGGGTDRITHEAGEANTSGELFVTIELTGDPGSYAINTDPDARPDWMTEPEWDAWVERLDADLELLRTTETGRESLLLLDEASRDSDDWVGYDEDTRITIIPYQPYDGGVQSVSFDTYVEALLNGERLPGEDSTRPVVSALTRSDRSYAIGDTISYGQANTADFAFGPPVLTLQHELSHSFDNLRGGTPDDEYVEVEYDQHGNEVNRSGPISEAELNAVGLDIDGDGDPDSVDTDDGQHHPPVFSENALRDELRRPTRDSYELGTSADRAPGHVVRYEELDGDAVEVDDE